MDIKTYNENRNKNTNSKKGPHFTLQWHVTAKCDQKCMHCYLYDSPTYKQELKNELSYEMCCKIIDDFSNTFNDWGMPAWINFTGGDPLLRDDILP